jgi:GeoRSP system SPASM domain protein
MNLDELGVPLIVYWDINPQLPIDPQIIRRICDNLLTNRIFMLNLWDPSSYLSAGASIILECLKNENINISLTVHHSVLNALDFTNFLPALKKILIQCDSIEQLSPITEKLQARKTNKFLIGISFPVSNQTFENIPDALSLCVKAGTKDIYFPIQRPEEDRKIFWPDTEKRRQVSEKVKSVVTDGLNIIVHDPFLWKMFNRTGNRNERGCQGGNTMVYISGNLDVTPCPLLPIVLGNLESTTLTAIFSSYERQQIRRQLSISPQECGKCDEINECKGGCRGRAYAAHKTFDKRDPACASSNRYF